MPNTTDHQRECRKDTCRSGSRNRFFAGKLMTADDLGREQAYGIERRRLINRGVHGWGVVYGLALERPKAPPSANAAPPPPPSAPLVVAPGFALDVHGRELLVVEALELGAMNTFWWKENQTNGRDVVSIEKLPAGHYLLSAHYAERPFEDAIVPGRCECDDIEKKYTCETVVFSLARIDKCACIEPACPHDHACAAHDSCGADARGPHATLCRWVTNAKVEADPKALCEWQGDWLDPEHGVPLGCVTIEAHVERCDPLLVSKIDDACGPRRLVKNNDLLYDLIRGCDLTRISGVTWATWHRNPRAMSWEQFNAMFLDPNPGDLGSKTMFEIEFSRSVRVETLTPDAVIMTVALEVEEYWIGLYRVPITAIEPIDVTDGEGSKLTKRIRVCVSTDWVEDEIESGTRLRRNTFTVEIEVRGDFILDCDGQALDANAPARPAVGESPDDGKIVLRPLPTGNGSPGGTFLSSFSVDPPATPPPGRRRRPAPPTTF